MRLHRCPKTTPAEVDVVSPATTCGCLRKLVRKVKKHGKLMRVFMGRSSTSCCVSSSSSPSQTVPCVKCNGASKCYNYNYDPLSYSLNFDSRRLVDDEDYFYQFCAFSSRFAAPRTLATTTTAAL